MIRRKGFNSLLPTQCGITDQCQHYKISWERYKRWKSSKVGNVEPDLKSQESLINLFPYVDPGAFGSATCLLSPPDELISLLSPITEGVEETPSFVTQAADSKLLAEATERLAVHKSDFGGTAPAETAMLDRYVLGELQKCGVDCNFGSGKLTHGFHFRDVYGSRLDRTDPDGGVSTKQFGWTCVDYIFQR